MGSFVRFLSPFVLLAACGKTPTTAISPATVELSSEAVDCADAWSPPEAFTGEDGLGHHGWELEDLTFSLAWTYGNRFENLWISDNSNAGASIRVRPWHVPEAGYCYLQGLEAAAATETPLHDTVGTASAFLHRDTAFDALEADTVEGISYDFSEGNALFRALKGLHGTENPLGGGPDRDAWNESSAEELQQVVDRWSPEAQEALATLVLSLATATELVDRAFADCDPDRARAIFDQFLDETYGTLYDAYYSPSMGTVMDDVLSEGENVDLRALAGAALVVSEAVDLALATLPGETPFEGGDIDFTTELGRVVIRSGDTDDTWTGDDLEDVVLLVDMGGDDTWSGRYAATHRYWMGASVVVDVAGDDTWGADTPDVEDEETAAEDAFDATYGFTQGAGLFGVGVLADAAGDDTYAASVYGQGTGAFGVGLLVDADGQDSYALGTAGQGQGYFGLGVLDDRGGDDRYGVYSVGQGAGRPAGQGLLLDGEGDDTYIAYYAGMDPYLPEPGYPDHYGLAGSGWAYSESDGTPHYMSIAQGTGWGYRGDWMSTAVGESTNWMGGMGALVDLGEGNDEHYADDMSMGQGFVYGFGFLYDGGGDDLYRTFWWGPAAAAHMGVGLFVEEDGDDDIYVSKYSGGWGYDCSVAWTLDNGGDDTYGGAFYYGVAYTYGLSFFLNTGGDDTYNTDQYRSSPYYGIVNKGAYNTNLVGVFMDLGAGNDTYNTDVEGVGNDTTWYLEPVGDDTDPDYHKGIGIDE